MGRVAHELKDFAKDDTTYQYNPPPPQKIKKNWRNCCAAEIWNLQKMIENQWNSWNNILKHTLKYFNQSMLLLEFFQEWNKRGKFL